MQETLIWKHCSSCKNSIGFKANYFVCNVSTCNRKRTGLVFCSVTCWDAHVPLMNHRECWAEERKAPSSQEWTAMIQKADEPIRRKRVPKVTTVPPVADDNPLNEESIKPKASKVILRRRREAND